MSETIASQRTVFSGQGFDPDAGVVHAAAPFIIGLIAAVIGTALLAPGLLSNGPLIAAALLVPSLIVSVGLYAWSVLYPGHVVGLVVDTSARTIDVIRANAFASRRVQVPFAGIDGISFQDRDHDDDRSRTAVLALDSGERLPLAFALDDASLRELQRSIGIGRA